MVKPFYRQEKEERLARITLTDIAAKAGVNVGTVSRVLNGKDKAGRISETLAERIRKIASKSGYLPNTSARALLTGKFNTIALVMSAIENRSYFPSGLLNGIYDALASHNMQLLLVKVPDDAFNNPKTVPEIFRSRAVDGLLVNYTHKAPPALSMAISDCGIPSIWLNTRQPQDAVFSDNQGAAQILTRKLIELGHRRIAYLNTGWQKPDAHELRDAHYSVRERLAGYTKSVHKAGLRPIVISHETVQPSFEFLIRFTHEWLQREKPTAIVAYWVNSLAPLIHVAWQNRVKVPQELSICCFGNETMPGGPLRISAMIEPEYALGQQAVAMLQRKIKSRRKTLASEAIPLTWVDFGTCVPRT